MNVAQHEGGTTSNHALLSHGVGQVRATELSSGLPFYSTDLKCDTVGCNINHTSDAKYLYESTYMNVTEKQVQTYLLDFLSVLGS